ncbi:MAG: 16S rRNA (uracil(1498)-N(3))-methyltransferase [Clostridia bacterium]|nr:16S rRNA (uracil(1498)-N(3))-methyltransferase [Clostridia bacterium]
MHRFFAKKTEEHRAVLLPEEETHARKVLRMEAGDECQALIEGRIYAAQIAALSPQVTVELKDELPSTEPSVRVTLYQGVPKGDKMDFIAQKCTEAGITRIVPVHFSRCVAQWSGKDGDKKITRFQRIAAEAAKQSGRAMVPIIAPPIPFRELEQCLPRHDLVLAPWEEATGKGIPSYLTNQKDIAILIGPEGGISAEEMALLQSWHAVPVTLGPRIFRTETAGLAALIALLTLTYDMGL